jgi:hypothetical protein
VDRRKIHRIASIRQNATRNPVSGETTIGITTLSRMPLHSTVLVDAMPAPTSPPIRACEDDDGRPKYQVIRFQVIAPTSADSTITRPCLPLGASMIPLPTVCATLVPRKAPTKFITAASSSASRGVSARVEIEVAIALAASWNPLV